VISAELPKMENYGKKNRRGFPYFSGLAEKIARA
jgi:hypothetical protein